MSKEVLNTFTSTVTGESFKINHHLYCNDQHNYFLTLKVCKKQYTGKQLIDLDCAGITVKKAIWDSLRGKKIK